MRIAGGYAIRTDPLLGVSETDTRTCGHCQRVDAIKPFCDPASVGGLCYCCNRYICVKCHHLAVCDVIEKKLERSEARGRLLASMSE
jgi:hypothetical protein